MPICQKCGKELTPYAEEFINFKIIEIWNKEMVLKHSNSSNKKFGVCLCVKCTRLFDNWLNEKEG